MRDCGGDHTPQVGKGVVRRQGKDVALVGYGTAVNSCLAAAEMLAANGISATVTDMRCVLIPMLSVCACERRV